MRHCTFRVITWSLLPDSRSLKLCVSLQPFRSATEGFPFFVLELRDKQTRRRSLHDVFSINALTLPLPAAFRVIQSKKKNLPNFPS
uniref:Uncharacterized protein n=1 Tax=Anopheles darlingi TaxID=43151 RepID=A0A2M4DEQ9_ANODA